MASRILIAGVASALAWMATSNAQTVAPSVQTTVKLQVDIPSQKLGLALTEFARQSGLQVVYSASLVEGWNAPALHGVMTAEEALSRLLTESNSTFEFLDAQTVTLVRKRDSSDSAGFQRTGLAPADAWTGSRVRLAQASGGAADTAPQSSKGLEEVLVTATKRAGTVRVHDAPLALTAFGDKQLEDAHVRDLSNIGNMMPNVLLNGSATIPGMATFSIRGMSINNSIPSTTPTVGVFIDGIYAGVGSGLVLDMFDTEAIEVLRGPQGLLFGRNVTAGAILVRTKTPTQNFEVTARVSVESGPSYTESLSLSGPITENILGKIAVYRNDDSGWFRNRYDGSKFGKSESTRVHAALSLWPQSDFATVLKLQYGKTDSDGPAVQSHGLFSRHSFDFDIDTRGFVNDEWLQVSAETTKDVAFGDGQIVNILGYRSADARALVDFDGMPVLLNNSARITKHHQVSEELRYSGTFGGVSVTSGVYYYTDDLLYIEGRTLQGGAAQLEGGGKQKSTTYAVYSEVDIPLPADFKLNLGARYSGEDKTGRVNRIVPIASALCSLQSESCSDFTFNNSHSWSFFTPKVGFEWVPSDATHAYAFWTKSNRSGGYNLRQTTSAPPGPYGQETADSFEIGLKQKALDDRLVVNLATFLNKFKDLQRDVSTNDPVLGSVQMTTNTADVTISGVEAELNARVTDGLTLNANAGYLHSSFDKIVYDLSGNRVVGPEDYALQLPMLSKWSYGASAAYTHDLANASTLSARVSFNHRDMAYTVDSNLGHLNAVNYLDADVSWEFGNGLTLSLYGKNLTDQVFYGHDVPLPFAPGETHSPLAKGRVLGFEVRYVMN